MKKPVSRESTHVPNGHPLKRTLLSQMTWKNKAPTRRARSYHRHSACVAAEIACVFLAIKTFNDSRRLPAENHRKEI